MRSGLPGNIQGISDRAFQLGVKNNVLGRAPKLCIVKRHVPIDLLEGHQGLFCDDWIKVGTLGDRSNASRVARPTHTRPTQNNSRRALDGVC